MISQQALFSQMELKLQQAKQAQTEAQMREALSALQVLCNVVLDSTEIETKLVVQPTVPTQILPQQLQTPQQSQQKKLFDDANGTSIFDF
ncbi:MAG: DUF5327 family protein [Lysinibacillus sp.]